jgi:hypothetical protein
MDAPMNSDDTKLRNRLITGKTTPGSQEAREQYRQVRLLLIWQWVGAAIIAGFAVYLSLSWVIFALLAVACIFGIPSQRKFVMRLRDNAYPKGSWAKGSSGE